MPDLKSYAFGSLLSLRIQFLGKSYHNLSDPTYLGWRSTEDYNCFGVLLNSGKGTQTVHLMGMDKSSVPVDPVESIPQIANYVCADKTLFLDMDIKHGKTPNFPKDI